MRAPIVGNREESQLFQIYFISERQSKESETDRVNFSFGMHL